MALRMTEAEFREWQRNRRYEQKQTPCGSIAGAAPTCCQPARPSGVSAEDMDRPKRNKYGNHKVELYGLKFDSQHEAAVYRQLMRQVRAGDLKCVMRQVRFDLGGGYHATKESRYQYIADFVTVDRENRVEIIDAKSEITRQNRTYINKKKQMLAEWGLEIREV